MSAATIATWVKLFAHFLAVMFGAHHTTSWSAGEWDHGHDRGGWFLYFTIDAEMASKAKAALERDGALCHEILDGSRHYEGEATKP